jgi:hypothetical protein
MASTANRLMEHEMTEFALRMYDTLDHAETARKALLAAGYDKDQVQIEAMNSEAGPVAGNFTVGNSSDHSSHSGIGDSGDYADNFKGVSHGAIIKLTVAVESESSLLQVNDVLDRAAAPQA